MNKKAAPAKSSNKPAVRKTSTAKTAKSVKKPAKSKTKTSSASNKTAMTRFKMEAAKEVGVNLKQGYNGHLTAKQAGSVGGQMVKKMVQKYGSNLK